MSQETSPITNWIVGVGTAAIIAVVGWVGLEMVNTRDAVRDVSNKLPSIQEDVTGIIDSVHTNNERMTARVEKYNAELTEVVKHLVTRPELESRILEIKTDAAEIKVEQSHINLELYKLQNSKAKNL